MGFFKERLRQGMRDFLKLNPAQNNSICINELLNFDANAFLNRLWFRGDSYELQQAYKQIGLNNFGFWSSVPTAGMEIRKIHTGIPKIIVNSLTNIVVDDIGDVIINDANLRDIWENTEIENDFHRLIHNAVRDTLAVGDGAFKISIDTEISQYPIVEYYTGEKVEFNLKRGRMREVVFKKDIVHKSTLYALHEIYGYGYIDYKLYNQYGDEISLAVLNDTSELQNVTFDPSFIMAIPMIFTGSDKWDGRGQSVFDSKRDNFDALDESWSQWMDALRAGRSKTYIPESLCPKDARNGEILNPNAFDNRYIKTESPMQEGVAYKIDTEQPIIPHDSYLATYCTALDLCLQGLISPSTLGIDVKKLDNAEAQREKEKATLYTRNCIVGTLQKILPQLINTTLKVYECYINPNNPKLKDVEIDVSFGEYANPSFESQVETVGKGKIQGIMSIEASVEELYGDTRDEVWKVEEVSRLKSEQGIFDVGNEPSVVDKVILDDEPIIAAETA